MWNIFQIKKTLGNDLIASLKLLQIARLYFKNQVDKTPRANFLIGRFRPLNIGLTPVR